MEGSGSAAEAAATATGLQQKPKLHGSTTCLITRVKLPVGTRLRHEDKGLCTLTEVAGNGNWLVRFEVSGDTHTYKPNAQHKLKVEAGQVKPAGVVVALEEGSQESSKPSRRAPSQARSKAAVCPCSGRYLTTQAQYIKLVTGSMLTRCGARWRT